jgi:hypothetical protein
MTFLQEDDLKIIPAQIVRGQGLCKLVVESVEVLYNEPTTPAKKFHNETQICCT